MVDIAFAFQRIAAADIVSAMTNEVKATLAQAIGTSIRNRWAYIAGRDLSRASSTTYIQALQEVRLNGSVATVVLLGNAANLLENGAPGRDLRDTLLGPNVPVVEARKGQRGKHLSKKGGYYRSIPFRHQGPGTLGSFGAPMGSAHVDGLGKAGAKALGKAIYAAAREMAPSHTEPFRVQAIRTTTRSGRPGNFSAGRSPIRFEPRKKGTMWGGRLAAGVGGAQRLMAHHSTDIYAGMVRMEKTYQGATQSSYMTFRTISTAKTTGWHTSASEGAGLMRKVSAEIPEMGKNVLKAFVAGLSAGASQGDVSQASP